MTPLKVLELPSSPGRTDVAAALRRLADDIEAGKYGDAHNLAWSLDCGDGRIEIGLQGKAPEPGVTAYYLFGIAQRKLEVL